VITLTRREKGRIRGRFTARVYTFCVRSDVPLPGETDDTRDADVELFRAENGQPRPFEPGEESRVYRSEGSATTRWGAIEVHRQACWYCLRCTGFVDFFFSTDRHITYFEEEGVSPEVVACLFLGPVCALLLELDGTPCLHASAVQVGEVAVSLAGPSGIGKSSLAASLVRAGCPLLSDDIVPLRLNGGRGLVIPGYPQMKLSPDVGRRLPVVINQPPQDLPGSDKRQVPVGRGWGSFSREVLPLEAIYVLEREAVADSAVRLLPLGPAESLLELLRFSFCARLVERLGLQPRRFPRLAAVASSVKVQRLRFPSDLERLDTMSSAILSDLA
jgi:hypothetical protein